MSTSITSRQLAFSNFHHSLVEAGVSPRYYAYPETMKRPVTDGWQTGLNAVGFEQALTLVNSKNIGWLFSGAGAGDHSVVVVDIDNDLFSEWFDNQLEKINYDRSKLAYRKAEGLTYASVHYYFKVDKNTLSIGGSKLKMLLDGKTSEIFHPWLTEGRQLVVAGSVRHYADQDATKGREKWDGVPVYDWHGSTIPDMPVELLEACEALLNGGSESAGRGKSASGWVMPDAKKYSRISNMVNQIIETVKTDKESGRIVAGAGLRNDYCYAIRKDFFNFLTSKQKTPSKEEVTSQMLDLQHRIAEALGYHEVKDADVVRNVKDLWEKLEARVEEKESEKYNHIKLADNLHQSKSVYADVNDNGQPTGRFYTLNQQTKLWTQCSNIDHLLSEQINDDGQYASPRINSQKTRIAARDHIEVHYFRDFSKPMRLGLVATKSYCLDVDKYARGAYKLSIGDQAGIALMDEAKRPISEDDLITTRLPFDPDYLEACPRTEVALKSMFPAQESAVERMLMFIGGFGMPALKMNKFLVWYGDSQAGKSTLARVLVSTWSEHGYVLHPTEGTRPSAKVSSVSFEQISKNNGIDKLEHAWVNFIEEIPPEVFGGNGTLGKLIIEGQLMEIRAAYQKQSRQYEPRAKWFMIGNSIPLASRGENTDAINNRMILLKANGRPVADRKGNNPHHGYELFQGEHIGIFQLLMAKLGKYIESGCKFPALDAGETERLQENKLMSNAPLAWMTEYMVWTGNPMDTIDVDTAYAHYKAALKIDSPGRVAESKNKFKQVIDELRFGEEYGEPCSVKFARQGGSRVFKLSGVRFSRKGEESLPEVQAAIRDQDAELRMARTTKEDLYALMAAGAPFGQGYARHSTSAVDEPFDDPQVVTFDVSNPNHI